MRLLCGKLYLHSTLCLFEELAHIMGGDRIFIEVKKQCGGSAILHPRGDSRGGAQISAFGNPQNRTQNKKIVQSINRILT